MSSETKWMKVIYRKLPLSTISTHPTLSPIIVGNPASNNRDDHNEFDEDNEHNNEHRIGSIIYHIIEYLFYLCFINYIQLYIYI